MILPIPEYVIVDFERRNMVVVAEATSKEEVADICKKYENCEVYKEQGEELYRCICASRTVVSHNE